jgi:hypothetical protein
MNVWKRFRAWMDREAELIAAETWAPCTSEDPKVQNTLAKLADARARMDYENVPTLLKAGRKNWRQEWRPKMKPALVLPLRGRK